MIKPPRTVSASFAAVLLMSAAAARSANADDSAIAAQIGAYMDAAVAHKGFTGAVLVARDGKPLVNKAYGLANRELNVANTPETKFRLGSITKQFTAMAVLILEHRGKLKVEDRIAAYLEDSPDAWQDITIRHLLTHTSGIPSFTGFPDYPKTMRLPSSPKETIARFKDKPLEFKPGEKFAYSNSGYVLLGAIIEKASGTSYEAFLKESILDPLGMKSTGYDHTETILENRASGYVRTGNSVRNSEYLDMSIPFAAGALYSTVGDMLLWDRSLDSETLVPRASLDRMFTPEKNNYGYGVIVTKRFGHTMIGHGGGINGFVTDFTRFPDEKLCIIVLCNEEQQRPGKVASDLSAILFDKPYSVPEPLKVLKVDPALFDDLAGVYELAPKFELTISRKGDKLMGQATNQGTAELRPVSEMKYVAEEADAEVTFFKDKDGKVTHLILHQGGRDTKANRIK